MPQVKSQENAGLQDLSRALFILQIKGDSITCYITLMFQNTNQKT